MGHLDSGIRQQQIANLDRIAVNPTAGETAVTYSMLATVLLVRVASRVSLPYEIDQVLKLAEWDVVELEGS